jgi:hypothetical protein
MRIGGGRSQKQTKETKGIAETGILTADDRLTADRDSVGETPTGATGTVALPQGTGPEELNSFARKVLDFSHTVMVWIVQ